MSRIVKLSNWGSWEQLDGQTLRNGEQLRITWPDGTREVVTVIVVDHGMPISDHGNTYMGQDVRGWVIVNHHGVEARIPVLGLEAERIP